MLAKFYSFPVFLTGRDRLHVRGIQNRGIIFRCPANFSEKDYPRSLTCHSILYLPAYSTMERMEEALHIAINSHRGFVSPEILLPWSLSWSQGGLSGAVSQPWILLFLLTSNQYKRLTAVHKDWMENSEIIKLWVKSNIYSGKNYNIFSLPTLLLEYLLLLNNNYHFKKPNIKNIYFLKYCT